MAVVVEEEMAADLAPNLVVIPVPRRQPCRRPPLQAASASPKQQQLDGGLLESTPPPVTAHMHRQIHIVRSTPASSAQPRRGPGRSGGGAPASACSSPPPPRGLRHRGHRAAMGEGERKGKEGAPPLRPPCAAAAAVSSCKPRHRWKERKGRGS